MSYRVIDHHDYKITKLTNVDTIELFIYPEDSHFLDRNFDIRISAAKMYQQVTTFTPLAGYSRELILLFGKIKLEHFEEDSIREKELLPYEKDSFSGDYKTLNYGISEDFNLIYKNELNPAPTLSVIKHGEKQSLHLKDNQFALIYSTEHLIDIDIIPENDYLADSVALKEQDSLLIYDETVDLLIHSAVPSTTNNKYIAIMCLFELPNKEDIS